MAGLGLRNGGGGGQVGVRQAGSVRPAEVEVDGIVQCRMCCNKELLVDHCMDRSLLGSMHATCRTWHSIQHDPLSDVGVSSGLHHVECAASGQLAVGGTGPLSCHMVLHGVAWCRMMLHGTMVFISQGHHPCINLQTST